MARARAGALPTDGVISIKPVKPTPARNASASTVPRNLRIGLSQRGRRRISRRVLLGGLSRTPPSRSALPPRSGRGRDGGGRARRARRAVLAWRARRAVLAWRARRAVLAWR